MGSFARDLRVAVRQLMKSPGFTTTSILMLALGIGATTAIFSIVEGVLLRPLPFPHSDQLVVLADALEGMDSTDDEAVTVPDIQNYTRDTRSFSSLGGYTFDNYELSGIGNPAAVNAARMTAGVFPALGVQPLLGRVFTQQEDDQRQPVAVLSYSTWQSRFQGDPEILGKKILLDRKPYVIIGVMPRSFEFPLVSGHLGHSELWLPFSFTEQELATANAANWSYQMVGRLKPGVTVAQALLDAEQVAAATVRNYPAIMAGFRIRAVVKGLREDTVAHARPLIRTLFFAVAVVLLIACANLAGLFLVRAIRRRREIAVRLALGARAPTLLWQAILESLVLSVTGGVVGLALAAGAVKLGTSLLPETLPRLDEIGLDWGVVAFALALAVTTGILCGLAPAFAAIRTNVNDTLKEGGRTGSSGGGHARLRSALVIAEIAVAMVLLTASGLLLRSFEKMRNVDLGFQPDHILGAAYSLPLKQYATQSSVDEFNHELLRRLRALPGVKSVGLSSFLPASSINSNRPFVAEGYVPTKSGSLDGATLAKVDGDYFQAMGIPLLRGRLLNEADKAGAQQVVVVNRKLAEQSWPGQDPIGKRIRFGTQSMDTPWETVVGEVADVKENSPDAPTKQQFYISVEQTGVMAGSLASPTDLYLNGGYIAVRTAMPPELMANELRATVRALDPQLPLDRVQSVEHALSDSEAPRKFNTVLITSFAVTAVFLAVLGIYSVIAFSVALRTQEIAIRMALGSQRAGIVRLILLSGAKQALAGSLIGLAGALATSHLLRTLLFGVSAFDPLVLTLSGVFVLLLALGACLPPAGRAASVDPNKALRSE